MRRKYLPSLSFFVLFTLALAACANMPPRPALVAASPTPTLIPTKTPLPPAHYTQVTVAHGFGSPDDLTLDAQGRIIFSDFGNNGVNRLDANGQITPLATGFPEPEGIVALPDGTLFIAVQGKDNEHIDRLERLAPGSATPVTIATFANNTSQPGIDGLGFDPRTGELLVPDSPNGTVYRISQDGATQTLIARGYVRPVDALVDASGDLYIIDEYGNAVVKLAPSGAKLWQTHISYPDDAAFDLDGTLLVTGLGINNLVRLDPATGKTLATLATNLFEPQGLGVDAHGDIFISEQRANIIVELQRG